MRERDKGRKRERERNLELTLISFIFVWWYHVSDVILSAYLKVRQQMLTDRILTIK